MFLAREAYVRGASLGDATLRAPEAGETHTAARGSVLGAIEVAPPGSQGFIKSTRHTLEINFELGLSWNTTILKKKKVLAGKCQTNSLRESGNFSQTLGKQPTHLGRAVIILSRRWHSPP